MNEYDGNVNEGYYDRKQQQEQFDAQQVIREKELTLQEQDISNQQQNQGTNQFVIMGFLVLATLMTLTIVTAIILKLRRTSS